MDRNRDDGWYCPAAERILSDRYGVTTDTDLVYIAKDISDYDDLAPIGDTISEDIRSLASSQGYLTAAELVAVLSTYPPDMRVVTPGLDGYAYLDIDLTVERAFLNSSTNDGSHANAGEGDGTEVLVIR